MRFAQALWVAAGLLVRTAASNDSVAAVKRVAIIGGGAAGASTAYHLRQFAEEDGVSVNITLFEKTDRIGGRTLTVNAYGNPLQRVELGASIFIELNHIMWKGAKTFNLSLHEPELGLGDLLGIWDGDSFVYIQNEEESRWRTLLKLFWKYGAVPYRTNNLVKATVSKFLQLYEAPYFPFTSLTERVYELDLATATGQTGEQFLEQNKVTGPFAHDIIQAGTRVNYASNLARIHGLDTMVALAPEGASQVAGGNWQIFSNMVAASRADVRANTSVSTISLASPGSASAALKYRVRTKSASPAESKADSDSELEFDNVVVATPFQFSGIKAGDGVLETPIDEIPYVHLHVTLFTSPFQLSAAFFQLPPGAQVPSTVLTTLAASDNATSGVQGAGKAGFFSISTLRATANPTSGRREYIYKIFSPEKVTASFLSDLLGADVPETVTGDAAATTDVITWYYPHVFYSYPKALPRVTFQDPVLGDGLYYTSGIESFISTMETSALAGKNVARLIVDGFQGLMTGGPVIAAGKETAEAAPKEQQAQQKSPATDEL